MYLYTTLPSNAAVYPKTENCPNASVVLGSAAVMYTQNLMQRHKPVLSWSSQLSEGAAHEAAVSDHHYNWICTGVLRQFEWVTRKF